MAEPVAYFITFTCYGHWLHGDERGSADDEHNLPGAPYLAADAQQKAHSQERMSQPSYEMDAVRRQTVLAALREVCAYRRWRLWAAHVRARHVHIVVTADAAPEKVMNDFKTYASRALNRAGLDEPTRKRWTRHGSTRYINDEGHLAAAINYVINRQGEKMETYEAPDAPRALDAPPTD